MDVRISFLFIALEVFVRAAVVDPENYNHVGGNRAPDPE